MVFGGQALARLPEGQVVFVWNALPGELVDIHMIKAKKNFFEAIATTIHESSPHRISPVDGHYLSSSPWQIVSPEYETQLKREIAAETYAKIADMIITHDQLTIEDDPTRHTHYRNKMEFSFAIDENGIPQLGLFVRGSKDRIVITDALLPDAAIMKTARTLLAWVQKHNISMRSLKSLIIRSNAKGETIAGLFLKDQLNFSDYPKAEGSLKGISIFYSTHKSPASVVTSTLYEDGTPALTESILGTKLTYGLFSFFQVNVPMFERALKDIAAFIDPKKPLLDFYAGVGAIGLPLAQSREKTTLVESNEQAVLYAKENIATNNIVGAEAHCTPAENMIALIEQDAQLILDPPRAGLHEKVIRQILRARPPRVVYLSCNLSTQARDMRLLSQSYKVTFVKLYNFFPRTPHTEGLVVMELL